MRTPHPFLQFWQGLQSYRFGPRAKRFIPVFLAGLALLLVSLGLFLAQPRPMVQISSSIYDVFLTRSPNPHLSPVPVIVDLDEDSLQRHGQWPWPRHRLALLLERLSQAGAAVVALDILLAEADRTSPQALLRSLREDLGIDARMEGLPADLYDNDTLLARVVAANPVVMGGFVNFDAAATHVFHPASVPHVERVPADALPARTGLLKGSGLVPLVPSLQQAGPIAFFNMMPDQDGLVRRVPLLIQAGPEIYASLSLRALMLGMGVKNLRLNCGPAGLESIGVGKLRVPVSPEGLMLVPYVGPAHSFPYISAADVLDSTFDPERVRGRIVFVGTSAVGLLDIRSTPLDRFVPGVEVHASVVNAILTNQHIRLSPWDSALQAGLIVLCGFVTLGLFALLPPVWAMATCGALAGGLFGGSAFLFQQGTFFSPLWGMVTLILEGTGLMGLRLWTTEADKRRLRNVFSRYVSPEVVRRIVDRGETVLRGEQRELTIMFTDLRGFTSISEGLTPEQVVVLLNRYFTPMTTLIRASEGTLDKFIGDALMAFWNAPLDVADHPRRAVTTALLMLQTLDDLNIQLQQELGVTLRMGVGLHTGTASVGNMGSEDLTSYTAIGDAVNLASRLEGLCSRYGVPLVMSEETATRCGDGIALLPLARLRVKGRSTPVDVFTAMSPEEAQARHKELQAYLTARTRYLHGIAHHDPDALREAAAAFSTLAADHPSRTFYHDYAEACAHCLGTSPDSWSEVWTLTSK